MNPVIGITPSIDEDSHTYFVNIDNMNAIVQSGGTPIILPLIVSKNNINRIADMIDGLYLTGGNDIDPTLFNEEPHINLGTIIPERDKFEITLIKETLEANKPILAVCRGCQILNIAIGGDMYQDIYSQIDHTLLQHQQNAPTGHGSHFVQIQNDSLLQKLSKTDKIKVNSRHHQANRRVPKPLVISGRSNDGIIEAVESEEHNFVLGLQWHPENMLAEQNDEVSTKIFTGFIEACKEGIN